MHLILRILCFLHNTTVVLALTYIAAVELYVVGFAHTVILQRLKDRYTKVAATQKGTSVIVPYMWFTVLIRCL